MGDERQEPEDADDRAGGDEDLAGAPRLEVGEDGPVGGGDERGGPRLGDGGLGGAPGVDAAMAMRVDGVVEPVTELVDRRGAGPRGPGRRAAIADR